LDIGNARRLLETGQASLTDIVNYYLTNIEKHNSRLNAIIEVYDDINQQIRIIEERLRKGEHLPLVGVVATVKDNICVKGRVATASSRILEHFISPYSATVVERLMNKGVVFIGRTNCDEFAMGSSTEKSVYGVSRNIWDEERVCGGSSGGSAVSVASGMCNLSLGSDTGGSVRQPSSFCGVTGYKPTYGTLSRYGLIAYASSLDQIGLIANHPWEISFVMREISGRDTRDPTTLDVSFDLDPHERKKPQTIIVWKNCIYGGVTDPEISNFFTILIDRLRHTGINIKEIDFELIDYVVPCYYVIACAEASSNLARYDGIKYGFSWREATSVDELITMTRTLGFGSEVKRRILVGTFVLSSGYYEAYFEKAAKARRLIYENVKNMLREGEVIMLPTTPGKAFRIGEKPDPIKMYMEDIFTVTANLCGIPAISLPVRIKGSLPFGIQLMAEQRKDQTLLAISNFLMDVIKEM